MEMQDLRIFVEVAKAQSISRAAATLHIGQPSASQRIAALEVDVGKTLFERHRHGVRLTEAGSSLLSYAERILFLADEAVDVVRATPDDRVRVRLAGPATANSYLLPPLLAVLDEAGYDVELLDAHSHEVMRYVMDGTVDVGFVIDIPNQPGIRRVPVHSDPILCVASPSHPLAVDAQLQGPRTLADLERHQPIFYRFSYDYKSLIARVAAERGGVDRGAAEPGAAVHSSRLRNVIETAPAESVKAMLHTGKYFAFLPRMTVARDISRRELVEIPVANLPTYTWNVAMVYRDRKELPKPVAVVLEAAKALWGQ